MHETHSVRLIVDRRLATGGPTDVGGLVLLADLAVAVGDDVLWVGVHAEETGDLRQNAGLFLTFPDRALGGGLPDVLGAAATDEIQRLLAAGTSVVVESYFARCLASHEALGARTGIALPLGLPKPTAYQLVCGEAERKRRLAARRKRVSRWDVLGECATEQLIGAYGRFPALRVDTTGRTPGQVVESILATSPQGGR